MARWQVTLAGKPTGVDIDDGLDLIPGDDGFSSEEALAMAEALGGDGLNYMGESLAPDSPPTSG